MFNLCFYTLQGRHFRLLYFRSRFWGWFWFLGLRAISPRSHPHKMRSCANQQPSLETVFFSSSHQLLCCWSTLKELSSRALEGGRLFGGGIKFAKQLHTPRAPCHAQWAIIRVSASRCYASQLMGEESQLVVYGYKDTIRNEMARVQRRTTWSMSLPPILNNLELFLSCQKQRRVRRRDLVFTYMYFLKI